MNILDFMNETGITPSGVEGRRLINHDCVFLLPNDWKKGDPIPEDITLIADPNYILKSGDKINIHKYAYLYRGPNSYEML